MEASIDLIKLGCALGLTVIIIGMVIASFNSNKNQVQGYVDEMTNVVRNLSDGELALYNNTEVTGLDVIQLIKDHAMSGMKVPDEDIGKIGSLGYPVYKIKIQSLDGGDNYEYYKKDGIPIYLDAQQTPNNLADDILLTQMNTEIYDNNSAQYVSKYGKFRSTLVTDENVSDNLTTLESVKYIVFSQIVKHEDSSFKFTTVTEEPANGEEDGVEGVEETEETVD